MKRKTNKNNYGFTLIETLIAIAILAVTISAALSLAAASIKFSLLGRDKLIGGNLAQEGIELILAYRVTNKLNGRSWLDGLIPPGPSACNTANGCGIDAVTRVPFNCTGGPNSNCFLRVGLDSVYSYRAGGTLTVFKRAIKIDVTRFDTDGTTPVEAKITSTVNWTNRFGAQSSVLKEYIEDWI